MSRPFFVCFLLLVCPLCTAADLRELDTRHYRIHTDVETSLAQDLGRRMDAMYDEYAQRLSIFKGADSLPPLQVYLFARQEDYLSFTAQRLKNTGGVFMPQRSLLAAFLGGQGRDSLRRTLQHEAFHQFVYQAISPDLPVWLNEGLAQLFEEGLWNGDGFLLGEVPPRRLRQLDADVKNKRLIDFATILSMTPQQWADRLAADRGAGATQYNQSWAMVHFLVQSKDESGNYRYRARLLKMLALLHAGRSADDSFREAFSAKIRHFQDRFFEYARGLKATPEATLIERQGVLADLLIELSARGHRFDDMREFRRLVLGGKYRLHYSRGELEWDTDRQISTYFCDPAGRQFDADELFLASHPGQLPDIVCQCGPHLRLRTRFHEQADQSDHELLIEPIQPTASILR